ncbi:phage shock protein operon transcriptional activator [Desertibaculum subflavum]|uniref:phage shock protein operon transcriptional activator n=1 Tax=Desertibaculum subflavum TaxID=2268458 RepID=UPI000E66DCC1
MATSTPDPSLPPLIGEAAAFAGVLSEVSRMAPLARPVLVVGERGTGKELIAARLHYLSRRWEQPFLKLNCGALPETLLEAELFGHEAGAFTGALRRRLGRFELADGGTLFLDEIASAGAAVQEKLLRAIEYGEFERLGSSETRRGDVRVIAAANVDLPELVAAGRFRADLLDRLAFDVVTLPPLRARRGDILLLAEHFGRAMARELGRRFAGFAPAARAALEGHDWPGNVRELKNVVERAVYRAEAEDRLIAEVTLDPFASPFRPAAAPAAADATPANEPATPPERSSPAPGFADRVAAFERELIEEALRRQRHNQRRAATALGLTYHQFRHQLRRHGLIGIA